MLSEKHEGQTVSFTPVTYTISADNSVSSVSYSLNDAFEKAREMTADGLKNVAITTHDGRVYRADDFPLLIKGREKLMPVDQDLKRS
jgi:hypothetical protein